jgi:hypothetical protein
MWQGLAQSRCRCGRDWPSPGADVAGISPSLACVFCSTVSAANLSGPLLAQHCSLQLTIFANKPRGICEARPRRQPPHRTCCRLLLCAARVTAVSRMLRWSSVSRSAVRTRLESSRHRPTRGRARLRWSHFLPFAQWPFRPMRCAGAAHSRLCSLSGRSGCSGPRRSSSRCVSASLTTYPSPPCPPPLTHTHAPCPVRRSRSRWRSFGHARAVEQWNGRSRRARLIRAARSRAHAAGAVERGAAGARELGGGAWVCAPVTHGGRSGRLLGRCDYPTYSMVSS